MEKFQEEILITYKIVKLKKKNGRNRILSIPNDKLKKYQTTLLCELFYQKKIRKRLSAACTAFKPNTRIIKNVSPHQKKKYILNFDIENFFDSIDSLKINTLLKVIFTQEELGLINRFCLFENKLPQGAPTSPMISNLILSKFDKQIIKIIQEINSKKKFSDKIMYTRYADDITISGDKDIFSFIKIVPKKLYKFGFKINKEKTRIYKSHERQIVTGLIVNQKINVPKEYYKKVRQELYYIGKYGFENHSKKIGLENVNFEDYMNSLMGKVNYISQYSKERKIKLKNLLTKI